MRRSHPDVAAAALLLAMSPMTIAVRWGATLHIAGGGVPAKCCVSQPCSCGRVYNPLGGCRACRRAA